MNYEDYLASNLSLADYASEGNLGREIARRKITADLGTSGIPFDCVTYEGNTFLVVLTMGLYRCLIESLKLLITGQTWTRRYRKMIKPCLKQEGKVIVLNSPSSKKLLKVCVKMINQAKQPEA